jgi:IrrE N-terminal-like domain
VVEKNMLKERSYIKKSSSTNKMSSNSKYLISNIMKDYPDLNFKVGSREHWSPKTNTITYNPNEPSDKFCCGLMHELAHSVLAHNSYGSDFELLKLESEAWALAAKLGKKYKIDINNDHIQNCLDTYRDWLHRRSTCPNCGVHTLQKDNKHYQCHNCQAVWRVSSGRFVRPYRQTKSARS